VREWTLGNGYDSSLGEVRWERLGDPAADPWGSEFFALVGAHTEVFRQLPAALHRLLLREYVATASSPGLRPEAMDALTAPWLGADGQAAFYRQPAQRGADQSYTDRIQGIGLTGGVLGRSGGRMAKMHADEADIDAELVRRLIRGQFPRWADLADVRLERLASGGTVNAIYRLGDALTVRLPLTEGGVEDVEWEARWLPRLAPALPVTIPTVVATGQPAEGYPWAWSVHRWIHGENPVEGRVAAPEALARDLADFVAALRRVDVDGAPGAYRGVPLATVDAPTRAAIEELRRTDEPFDGGALMAAWEAALAAPPWKGPPRWVHSDLMPSNLLVTGGRLSAVIDFGTAGVGDPACDLIPAWNLLPPPAREVFRNAVDVDDATWTRGRGWALSMAVIQLPYYRHTNLVISANARHVIREVLAA
jgi:aminoglycoside phosphotransferase (APT) family kinase protein